MTKSGQAPTTSECLRFLGIATGSRGELEPQLVLAERLAYLTSDQACKLPDRYERMLVGLVQS